MKRLAVCFISFALAFSLGAVPALARAEGTTNLGYQSGETGSFDRADTEDDAIATQEVGGWTERPNRSLSSQYTAHSIGVGGHGAVFDPVISPFDPQTFVVDCDMGGLYVTHDAGMSWDIKSYGGMFWDIKADPSTEGVFYAAGSGLWRSQDNGDSWDLLWPDPATIDYQLMKQSQKRTNYYSTSSYPDASVVDTVAVDPTDPRHLIAITSEAVNSMVYNGRSLTRGIFESTDGGSTFTLIANYNPTKDFIDNGLAVNSHVFIEPAALATQSRVVISYPDGVFEANRSTQGVTPLYEPATAERIIDCAQVNDAAGIHYIVLETANTGDDSAAFSQHTRISLWHTTDFADASKKVDLTDELVASLPREYNEKLDRGPDGDRTVGEAREIQAHNALGLCAPSLERIYLSYKTYETTGPEARNTQGINGLIAYDATRSQGNRFYWVYGLRLWWKDWDIPVTPDQNMLMERAHCDAAFTMLGIAVNPSDPRQIVLTTHATLLYSPNIDVQTTYQASTNRNRVNLYPRYARVVEDNADYPGNPGMARTRSTGLEVTVTYRIATDPFDKQHLIMEMDDTALANSYDGGETWYSLYMNKPTGFSDIGGDVIFDEGKPGVVYALWHTTGMAKDMPKTALLSARGIIARSPNGGKTWETFSSGIPEQTAIVDMDIVYPRDAAGNIMDGPRTIYVATMGRGFYVSHDSGVTFQSMNAGIPTVRTSGVDAVWALAVHATDDGRLFGLTSYSTLGSTNHATQGADTFGNVWEWDATANGGAGQWVRLPFSQEGAAFAGSPATYKGDVQARRPTDLYYDDATRTLYVTGGIVQGPNVPYGSGSRITNFGGGLYAYTCAKGAAVGSGSVSAIDMGSPLLGNERGLSGIGRDARGNLWLATEDGDVYVNGGVAEASDAASGWTQVLDDTLCLCYDFDFGPDGEVYFLTRGVGAFLIAPNWDSMQPYVITLNPDGAWSKESSSGHIIASNAEYAKFMSVLVDGTVLGSSNYDVESGSTKVMLHPDYLETLDIGVHQLIIRSNDGEASTTFIIQGTAGATGPNASGSGDSAGEGSGSGNGSGGEGADAGSRSDSGGIGVTDAAAETDSSSRNADGSKTSSVAYAQKVQGSQNTMMPKVGDDAIVRAAPVFLLTGIAVMVVLLANARRSRD